MIKTSQQQFIDSVFGIRDLADPSKVGQFDASAISADTARVLAFPNASGTMALEGWVNDNFLSLDGEGSDVVNGTFNLTTTGLGTFGSLTAGGLTLNGFTGILKAVIGVVTSDAVHGDLADADWTTVSDHDLRYFTETELGSNANALGASLIGIEDSMAMYAATDVEAALKEVMDEITIVTHVADSVTMDVGTATGSVSDTQIINESEYVVHETTGLPDPNFVTTFDFSGITAGHEPNLIELHWGYNGGSSHIVELQMYNYNTSTWDVINNTILTDNEGNFLFNSFGITDGGGAIVDYTSGGAARVRFSHAANGNAAHDFLIDYLAIKDDHGIGSGITDHGSMSGLDDDDHIEYHNDARAGVWLAANHETTYNHGNFNDAYSHVSADGSSHSIVGSNTTAIGLNTTHRGETSGNPHSVTPTELSLVIGTDVQAHGNVLDNLNTVGQVGADNEFLVGTAAGAFAWENAFTARTSLGVGTGDTPTFAGGLFTGSVTIFNSNPILIFKDSNNTGDDSVGFIEWRDSANTRLGFFGNSTNLNDDLLWKNESTGGHIGIQTIGGGEFRIFANTVLTGILDINPSANSSIDVRENSFGEGAVIVAELQGTTTGGLGTGFSMKDVLLVRGSGAEALLVFSNSDFTGTACIDYATATDILSFKDAASYTFDAPVDFSSQNLTNIGTIASGVITQSGTTLANTYQPLDAELTSLASLSYAAASFIKMTGANTFALRTIGETADDLEGTIVHDNLASVHQGVTTGDSPIFADVIIANNGTVGPTVGPVLTFTTAGIGVGTSAPNLPLDVTRTTAATSSLSATMAVTLVSTGTPIAGFGPSVTFFAETSTPNVIEPVASFGGIWEDATAGSVDGAFVLNTRINSGGFVRQMKIGADGGIHFANMKSGTDQANAGAAVGELYFDTNDGNTIKMGV